MKVKTISYDYFNAVIDTEITVISQLDREHRYTKIMSLLTEKLRFELFEIMFNISLNTFLEINYAESNRSKPSLNFKKLLSSLQLRRAWPIVSEYEKNLQIGKYRWLEDNVKFIIDPVLRNRLTVEESEDSEISEKQELLKMAREARGARRSFMSVELNFSNKFKFKLRGKNARVLILSAIEYTYDRPRVISVTEFNAAI